MSAETNRATLDGIETTTWYLVVLLFFLRGDGAKNSLTLDTFSNNIVNVAC